MGAMRLQTATLAEAVAPEPLEEVLASLVEMGALSRYQVRGDEVVIWGDLLPLESRLRLCAPPSDDSRADYYRTAVAFVGTWAFRRMPIRDRQVWRLHSAGRSVSQIASRLDLALMAVRWSIGRGRVAAGLPTPPCLVRNPSGGRPPAPRLACRAPGCGEQAESRQLCGPHYHRARRIAREVVVAMIGA